MAEEPSDGLRVKTGLPKENGLSPLATQIMDAPTAPVIVIGVLRLDDIVHHVAADSRTGVLDISQIEADLTADEVRVVMGVLARAQERRTGRVAITGIDGEPTGELEPPEEETTDAAGTVAIDDGSGEPMFVAPPLASVQ